MKINQIIVNAGRTFNHPYEQYSNLRPSVQFVATIEEGDDPEKCTKELQAKAESMVEDHKQNMLRSLHQIRQMDIRHREMAKLESLITTSQKELENYRANPIEGKPPLDFFAERRDESQEDCPRCGEIRVACDCFPAE